MIQAYFAFLKNIAAASHLAKEFRPIREFIGINKGYIRFVIQFIDDSELHVFEHVDSSLHRTDYSYHWQDKDKKIIARWDNAPHHPEIENFPHHLHLKETLKAVREPSFMDVLKKIESHLTLTE